MRSCEVEIHVICVSEHATTRIWFREKSFQLPDLISVWATNWKLDEGRKKERKEEKGL